MSTTTTKDKTETPPPEVHESGVLLCAPEDGYSILSIETDRPDSLSRFEIKWYYTHTPKGLPMLESRYGAKLYMAENEQQVAQAAMDYIREVSETNPTEFVARIGSDAAIVAWMFGEEAVIGDRVFETVDDFIASYGAPELHEDLYLFADKKPRKVRRISKDLTESLGFVPTLAYKWS